MLKSNLEDIISLKESQDYQCNSFYLYIMVSDTGFKTGNIVNEYHVEVKRALELVKEMDNHLDNDQKKYLESNIELLKKQHQQVWH